MHQVNNCNSISESEQPSTSVLSPPSTSLNQDTLLCCISTVFVFLPQNFVAFVCIGSSDVHHPESQPSIWHFHGFQVIANWRLAAIARTLELLQKSKQKIRNSNGMWWGWKLLKALWSQKAFSQIIDNCCDLMVLNLLLLQRRVSEDTRTRDALSSQQHSHLSSSKIRRYIKLLWFLPPCLRI